MRRKEDMENWRKEMKAENEHLKNEVQSLKVMLEEKAKIDALEANLSATMEKWKETEAALVSCRKELAVSASELECEKALRIATEEKLKAATAPPKAAEPFIEKNEVPAEPQNDALPPMPQPGEVPFVSASSVESPVPPTLAWTESPAA